MKRRLIKCWKWLKSGDRVQERIKQICYHSHLHTLIPSLPINITQSRLEAVSSLQSRVEAAERRSANAAETAAARIEGLEAKVAAAVALAAAGGGGGAVAEAHIRHLEEEVWG